MKINIVDTPGHADFGGEVERVLNMVDGVLLLVDAVDGPMPQTKFVLRRRWRRGHKAIVVINKIDRPDARPNHVLNETFDLFLDLGARTSSASSRSSTRTRSSAPRAPITGTSAQRWSRSSKRSWTRSRRPTSTRMRPLQLLVTTTAHDEYKGRIAIGRLQSGTLRRAQSVMRIDHEGALTPAKVTQLFTFQGLGRQEIDEAKAGDIVAIAGVPRCRHRRHHRGRRRPAPVPPIKVEEPTLRMTFSVNTSPFAGREGTHVTSRKIRERLYAELETNVALRVEDTDSPDALVVSGRGELHLAILIENHPARRVRAAGLAARGHPEEGRRGAAGAVRDP